MSTPWGFSVKHEGSDDSAWIGVNFLEPDIEIDFSDGFNTMKTIQSEIIILQGESSAPIRAYKSGTTFTGTDYMANIFIFNKEDASDCLFTDIMFEEDESFVFQLKSEVTSALDPGFYNVIVQLRSYSLDDNKLCKIPMRIKEAEYVFE